jgi:DNA-binding SARP family transcriptional activator/TolB-like protein
MLSLATLGRLSVAVGQREIAGLQRKSRTLLGYLALSEAGEETRERLVGLLWSETPEDKARASLRQVLHELRTTMDAAGFDGLSSDKLAIRLDRSRITVDLGAILAEAEAGRAHPLLQQSQRPFERLLDEFETIDPAFRVWLLAKRQTLGNRVMRLLETAMRQEGRQPADREALARALQNLDPTHEEAARVLIHARANAGDIGGALGVYKALWDLLDSEYDVEPSKETQELIAAIKLGQSVTGPTFRTDVPGVASGAATAIALPEPTTANPSKGRQWSKLMLAVASFDGSAARPEHRYLVDGFRRELVACLVRFREWMVRDVTFGAAPTAEPQRSDGAEYAVEASAHDAGDALRLIITLRDLATNSYLWSERLNVSVANWFEAQQLVVRRITTALNVHLSAERMVTIAHRPPSDMKAYDLWLLGQATFLSFDPRNWDRARSLFHQVTGQMPDFAPAYSSLAQMNNSDHIVKPGVFRDASRTAEALAHAREAARLDPIDSRSQLCLGWSHAMAKRYEQAMVYIPLAYELNENDPWTLVSSALCFAFCGQYEYAREIAEHALRLPLAPSPLQWAYHQAIRFMCGDYSGVIQAAEAGGDVTPSAPGYKVSALFHLGDPERAAAELQRFIDVIRARWVGQEPPSDANIIRWFLTMFPIKSAEDWQRLRDGMAGAGAPVEGLAHDEW